MIPQAASCYTLAFPHLIVCKSCFVSDNNPSSNLSSQCSHHAVYHTSPYMDLLRLPVTAHSLFIIDRFLRLPAAAYRSFMMAFDDHFECLRFNSFLKLKRVSLSFIRIHLSLFDAGNRLKNVSLIHVNGITLGSVR